MSNELAVAYKANDGTEVELDAQSVQKFILSGNAQATDAEVAGFLAVCKARGMNPLAKDAYLVKYGSGPAATITSKDYFIRTANEDPEFDGFKAGIVIAKPGGLEYREGALKGREEVLVGGWAEVYSKQRKVPVRSEVAFDEYNSGKSLWASKPATMIRKVALVQALREAFPAKFGGLYDQSEIRSMPTQPVQQVEPQKQSRKMTQEEAKELADLCQEASMACGQPVDVVKRYVWETNGAFDGSCEWSFYIGRARAIAVEFVEAHMADEAEDVPYES